MYLARVTIYTFLSSAGERKSQYHILCEFSRSWTYVYIQQWNNNKESHHMQHWELITEFVVYGLMRFDVKWKPTNLLANGKDQDELKKSQISNEAFGGYWLLLLYKGVYVAAESEPRVARSLMSTGSLKQTWWKFQDKAMFNYICYHLSTRLSGLNTLRSIFSHFAADTEFAHRSLANLGTIHHL